MTQKAPKKALIFILPLAFANQSGLAAETTINGFASFVGGFTTSSTELPSGEDSTYAIDLGYSDAGLNEKAIYSDKLSFDPDSNYAVQVKSDLNHGLTVSAQISGRGSKNFNAELEWAYLSYELTPSLTLQAGRQRTPVYYYSDFIDVGYAYHWIRPPVEVYDNSFPTYEGVSLTYTGSLGSWAGKARFYTGSVENTSTRFGLFGAESAYGTTFNISNDYLQINASTLFADFYTTGVSGKDSPVASVFGSLSVNLTLGNMFALAEATQGVVQDDDEFFALQNSDIELNALGSSMASIGYEFGNFTPHLTFATAYLDLFDGNTPALSGQSIKRSSVTAGLRWDFHPAAAFKFEYSSSSDDSTDLIIQTQGKVAEADLVTFGFDVIF